MIDRSWVLHLGGTIATTLAVTRPRRSLKVHLCAAATKQQAAEHRVAWLESKRSPWLRK
jgi:hypothetical protein